MTDCLLSLIIFFLIVVLLFGMINKKNNIVRTPLADNNIYTFQPTVPNETVIEENNNNKNENNNFNYNKQFSDDFHDFDPNDIYLTV